MEPIFVLVLLPNNDLQKQMNTKNAWKEKEFFIYLASGIVLSGIFLYVFFTNFKLPKPAKPSSIIPTPIPVAKSSDRRITISGISVKDFRLTSQEVSPDGVYLIVQNEQYTISYLERFNKFYITILVFPFYQILDVAQADFLSRLGISKNDACRLNVAVTTIRTQNPWFAGHEYPMTICGK